VDNSGGIQASLAGRYATALFGLARDEKALDAVEASLGTLAAALHDSADLNALIASPRHSRDALRDVVAAMAKSLKLDPVTTRFLGVVAQNRRLRELRAIIRAFGLLAARHRGETSAEIVSARPLDEDQAAAIARNLESRLGRKVRLHRSVDPAILGGLVVKVGSEMIDGSIRTRLNRLAHAMKG